MGNVFFKLLNMSIAAGWLVLAVAALRLVFKKAPRWVFCVLWAMVALRLALPFSVQSPFSVVPSVNTVSVVTEPVSSDPVSVPDEYSAPQTAIPAEVSSPQGYVSPSEHSVPEEPVSRPAHTETDPSPVIPGAVDAAHTDNAHQQIQRIVIKTGIPAIDNTISAAETERAYTGEEQTGDIGAVLFWIWASGAALMASYAAFSYLRLRLRLRCSIKGADGAYVCDTIDTPFILGLFRPRIYVPSGMNGRERSYVLAHEKAHLRRFDHLWKPLGYLMLAAYWFNPLMWLAYIFFCRDIEIACDEKVVKTLDTESKAGYSQTLLDLNRPRRMISACPLAFGEVGVKERIKKVLSYKKPTLWILIAALLLTTVLAVCLMTDPKESSSAAESGEDASLPDGGSEEESKDTGENSTEEQFVPGGDIEIPDFLSKPFKELSAHPVPGTLNIYTCDELGGARAIFQTDGTSKARIDECFVFDHEYTDPASDYTMRVYAGRRFMNNGDGTYRAKTAYAVVGDLSDSPQYFEEEPVVYGKLVIVDYTDANGSVAGRRVFAPGLDNDPEIKYFDQVYTREGSDYILVNYSYYYESAERRPNWFVFDKNGTAYSLPVPAQYRWNVNSISFDTSSDDPDDVIAKYVLDDDTVTTVKANLKDMRPFTDLSAYYCKAPESSKHVLVLDPVEGSDLFYTCDEYPGKNIINGINSQTSFVFVVDEELFSLTGPDGTKATVFSGTDVHYGSGDLIEVESYALVCGDTKTVVRADTAPRKLGDNLFYYTDKDDGFIPSGVLFFIMDSHLMHFSCFSEPGVREGVDGVFFTNEYPDTAELGEWVVIGKDGVLRSLPELDGKRYLIKDIAFDPAYAEGGRVRVTAYRWNMELLGYEEFSFGADLASCRAVGLEYYGLGINDLYGNYTFKNVYPEVSASSLPTKAGFFELDAFPGYMLLRTKENRVIKLIKQFDDTAKWERDGKEYEARGYDADIYGISNGKLVYLELGSAVICGENAKPWGYGRTVKYHNLFISSEFDETDGRLCYSYDPSGSGKILSVEYQDLTYGRKNEFCMVSNLIIDWQGCTYSLEGDGKPFAVDEIKYDEEKGMIAYTESSQQSYFGEFKYIAFEDLHRDDATNYDLISVDPSGEKPSFPGKKIICAGVDGEYPFYVVDKELFTLDWDGKKASGFEGRFVEYAGGKVKTSWCFGVACGDKVCRFNHKGASLYAKGKLAIYEDKERATGYVLTGFGETFEKYRFETISVRDGADCVILNDVTWSERNLYPASMIIGLDGSVRSLPVADEIRWRLIRIEFNYASDDPNAVVVHWYKYFTMHASANEFPSYRIGSPFAASVKDTSPVEFAEYYASDPAEHWNY